MAERGNTVGKQFGSYYLVEQLGQGVFADVYLGEHTTLKTRVAIKVLHTHLGSTAPYIRGHSALEKFLAQARTISELQHPHIVRVLEYGVEHDSPFLIMDYAPYGTLRQWHPKGTQLPLSTIVSYIKQLADALEYVHDKDIIHRDIKPHNMLLGANYEVLLSDFGIAVVAESRGYRRLKAQDFEGTIIYAAPEQMRGRPQKASDQYALGVVVYEWLSGVWPFHGSVEQIASQHTLARPPSLSEKVPTILPAVEQVVLKALAKDPNERFENIQAFATALDRASRLEQLRLGTRVVGSLGRPQHTPHPLAPASPLPPLLPQVALSPLPMKTAHDEAGATSPSPVTLFTYRGHSERVHTLAWSPHGAASSEHGSGTLPTTTQPSAIRIASSSFDETVQIWDALTGENRFTHRGDSLQPQAIAWSPDGKCIASTRDLLSEKVQLWDATSGRKTAGHVVYSGHTERVQAIAWSPDGTFIASASDDATVQIWHARTGRHIMTYRGHSLSVKTLAWSPDGASSSPGGSLKVASGSEDKTVHVWDAKTGANILVYYAHLDMVNAVTWSPGGTHIASASDDATVQVWDATTGRKVCAYTAHAGGVTDVAWSSDGVRIASSSLDETVRVWNAITGSNILRYTGHSDWVGTLAWSPDGRYIASGSWDKTVQVWEVK